MRLTVLVNNSVRFAIAMKFLKNTRMIFENGGDKEICVLDYGCSNLKEEGTTAFSLR
jgi:hypothetical protein